MWQAEVLDALGATPATQPGAQSPPWRIPTPRPLAFSCRNFRNFVRKMYREASPFEGWENKGLC